MLALFNNSQYSYRVHQGFRLHQTTMAKLSKPAQIPDTHDKLI